MRLGVEDRDAVRRVSSACAGGDRMAAMECGEGIVAVRVLLRPRDQQRRREREGEWGVKVRLDCFAGGAATGHAQQETTR